MAFSNGILNNRGFLLRYLTPVTTNPSFVRRTENPLTAALKFAPINIWPIVAPWNHSKLLAICAIYSEVRYHFEQCPNPALKKAIIAEEILSLKIPNAKYATQAASHTSLKEYMMKAFQDEIFDNLGEYTNVQYAEFKNREDINAHFDVATLPPVYPWTAEQIAEINISQCVFMLFFFAEYQRIPMAHQAIETIIMAYCALSKRGQVTDEFCVKIQNSVRDELGINIILNQAALNALYKGYMQGVNETNAQEVFEYLNNLIPDRALRLKLTIQQAAGSGMTLYIIIGRALNKYRTFPWGRCNTLTGGELRSWDAARKIVGDNIYYGLKRDMGAARSTLYKSIGYVARELLVKINGERTLLRYAGLAGKIKNKNALDRLINDFVEHYTQEEREETEEEPIEEPIFLMK